LTSPAAPTDPRREPGGDAALDSSFGPSALATPANGVTVARLLLSPAVFALIVADTVSWLTWAAWAGLACTDGLDGWLARRHGRTRSGAFLDPLADKVLMLGGLFALVAVERFWVLPVAIITAREVVISLFRVYWGRRGIAVHASQLAKLKTFSQALAVGFAVFPPFIDLPRLADIALWTAVALAVVSGVQYLLAGSRAGSHT
jgi:CDP-diacylglycerol--glycerol-3-phosphate 3-phosphatidyltransferase